MLQWLINSILRQSYSYAVHEPKDEDIAYRWAIRFS
jgi:hypothetical protein